MRFLFCQRVQVTANMKQVLAIITAFLACFIVGAIGGVAARKGRRFK